MAAKNIVFITGANTGIGFEAVKALLQSSKPYHVLLGSRSPAKGDEAISQLAQEVSTTHNTVETVQVDITDDSSINQAFDLVKSKFGRLDALVNNAGAAFDSTFDKDASNFRALFNKTWDVNVTGTQVLTATFAPLLLASPSPRLIFLTSGLSTLAGNTDTFMPAWVANPSAGWPKTGLVSSQAYRSVKAGLNYVMLMWHWILKEDGVKTWAVSPGFLATSLGDRKELLKKAGAGHPSLGGAIITKVLEGEHDDLVGRVVSQDGSVQPW